MLKNPLIIGLIIGILVYAYLYWQNKNKKKSERGEINYKIPIIAGFMGFVGSYFYFKNSEQVDIILPEAPVQAPVNNPSSNVANIDNMNNDVMYNGSDGSNLSNSYHFIGRKNIKLPNTDVFIDIAKF